MERYISSTALLRKFSFHVVPWRLQQHFGDDVVYPTTSSEVDCRVSAFMRWEHVSWHCFIGTDVTNVKARRYVYNCVYDDIVKLRAL